MFGNCATVFRVLDVIRNSVCQGYDKPSDDEQKNSRFITGRWIRHQIIQVDSDSCFILSALSLLFFPQRHVINFSFSLPVAYPKKMDCSSGMGHIAMPLIPGTREKAWAARCLAVSLCRSQSTKPSPEDHRFNNGLG